MKKLGFWQSGQTPTEVWDLAIEKVSAGEHLVSAILTAVFDLWKNPPGDENGGLYQKQAPEVEALSIIRKLDPPQQGIDHYGDYTKEKSIGLLEKAKSISLDV